MDLSFYFSVDAFESVFSHEYFLSVYGVLIYYTLILAIEKKLFYNKHPKLKFSFKRWKSDNATSFMATILIAPLVIIFDDEIVAVYNGFVEKDIEFSRLIYLCAGPITAFLTGLITRYKGQLGNGN